MTANTKTLEAIRVCRKAADDTEHDGEAFRALADALEESIQPPAEKRGEAGGDIPVNFCPLCGATDPRNMTCPKCGRTCTAGFIKPERQPSPPPSREGEGLPFIPEHLNTHDGLSCRLALIWGPQPGEKMPHIVREATDADLAAVLKAMPEERRSRLVAPYVGLREDYIARANVLRERAEAAEARAREGDRLLLKSKQSASEWERYYRNEYGKRESAEKELEAARARVGELERWIPVLGMLLAFRERGSIVTDGRQLYDPIDTVTGLRADAATSEQMAEWTRWFENLKTRPTPSAPTPASTVAAVADALPTDAEDERVVDALMAKRPVVTRPLADAPTPAVVDPPPCEARRAVKTGVPCILHADHPGSHVWQDSARPLAEESPPRDSGGENAGEKRWNTGKDQWTHGEKMPGDWHKFLGPCPSCGSRCFNYGGGWRCLDQYCRNSASNPSPNVGPVPWWWETDIQVVSVGPDWEARGLETWAQGGTPGHAASVLRAAKERTHEQRKDPSETAEAKTPEVGPVADATRAGVPGRESGDGGDRRVAPPGLTPEESEEGRRKPVYSDCSPVSHDEAEQIAQRFVDYFFGNKAETPRVSIPARPGHDDDIRLHAYIEQQKAHSEGAKAAKAGGGKVAGRAREAVRRARWILETTEETGARYAAAELVETLEILAAELETGKA